MNQKLDHLRNFIAKSKTNKIKSFESTEDTAGPARKRKRKREPSPESLSKNLDKKPFPTANGILLTKSKLEQKAQEDSEMIRNFGKASSPINKHVHFDKSMVGSITSSSAGKLKITFCVGSKGIMYTSIFYNTVFKPLGKILLYST